MYKRVVVVVREGQEVVTMRVSPMQVSVTMPVGYLTWI